MARRERVWVRVRTLTQAEKADIASAIYAN